MSEPPADTPTTTPLLRADRWSGRKTLIFIIVASLVLWVMILWLVTDVL